MSNYTVIKEYDGCTCCVRTNCYGSSLRFLEDLFELIVTDFPTITREDVEVKYYGGSSHKRTFGLEFRTMKEVPANYFRCSLQPTL